MKLPGRYQMDIYQPTTLFSRSLCICCFKFIVQGLDCFDIGLIDQQYCHGKYDINYCVRCVFCPMKHSQQEKHKILKIFIAGGIAGSLNKTIIAPVERVKYLFVTSNRVFSYRLFVEDFSFMVKQHGIANLWRGNSMNIFRMFPHAAIDFATFDFLRGKYYRKQEKSVKMKNILFLCGAFSGITALSCTDSLQFVRIRLAMQKSDFTYSNSLNAFSVIYKNQGFLGFYKGYGAACLGVFIYQGISFSLYTYLKELVNEKNPKLYKKWYVDFIFGGISALGQIIAYPLDILRKRMQGQVLLIQKGLLDRKQNYRELITSIYKKENGIKGFFKGVTLNLIKHLSPLLQHGL